MPDTREDHKLMRVKVEFLNVNTPVFTLDAGENAPARRAWGATWAGDRWRFPAYHPFGIWAASDLRKLHPEAMWDSEAERHVGTLEVDQEEWLRAEASWRGGGDPLHTTDSRFPPIPPDFFPQGFAPYQHQRYGMARVRLWPRSWFLWEQRTGKTRTMLDGLRLLELEGKFERALVLGPPVVLPGWVEETHRVSRGAWTAVILDGSEASKERARSAKVILVSYARARLEAQIEMPHPQFGTYKVFAPEASPLRDLGYDVIVADESHNLGNWKSDQTRAAVELSKRAARRYCLTGTGGDQPLKVYGQLHFLAPGLVPLSWERFEEKHVVRPEHMPHIITGYRGLNEINAVIDSVATRLKRAECMDLPPRVTIDVPFNLGPRQRARYNEMVAEMRASVTPALEYLHAKDQSEPVESTAETLFNLPHGATRVQKLLQLLSGFVLLGPDDSICDTCPRMETCVEEKIRPYTKKCEIVKTKPARRVLRDVENPKLELFEALVESVLNEDPTNKMIVWGVFDVELDDMMKACARLGGNPVRLDGDTTKNVTEIRARFQGDPTCRTLVGMVTAGVGIDLSAANYMLYYTPPWQPLVYSQAEDRNTGPGQKRPMTVYRLLTSAETPALDRFVVGVLKFKNRVAYTMLERVACASCDRQGACALDGTRPFQENCKYAASVARPVTKVHLL
jgi:hypothetical protein